MDPRDCEGLSEEVECVPVPGVDHPTTGLERLDEMAGFMVGDQGPGPVLAAESAAHGGPPHLRRRGGEMDERMDVVWPNPARGLDRKAAIARVHASPEVRPPQVEARRRRMLWRNRNAEFLKMRPLPLFSVIAAGVALPFAVRAALGR